MGKITVLDGGFFTTVQDVGRFGFRKCGIPISGVMDENAYQYANELVQNPLGSPVLECTLVGGSYRFDTDACIAITGADMNPEINGKDALQNKTLLIDKGGILTLKRAIRGCRTYIGIRGKWDLKCVLGSYSTNVQSNFGGLNGKALQKEDFFKWNEYPDAPISKSIPRERIPYYSSKRTIFFEKGPEFEWLNASAKEQLLSTSFSVSSKSNRMAIRLQSENELEAPELQMKSSPVMPGIIQLPPNGNPIILMKDAQTVGGYPRIGIISEHYLSLLAQVPSNGIIRFELR